MGAHHDHSHDVRNIGVAFFLNLAFTLIELVGGVLTNSVAILSDALHDLGDTISLGLAYGLQRYSQKGASDRFSYGYRRFSLLGALITAVVLLVGSVFVLLEAVPRLLRPEAADAEGMVALAILGVAVNGVAMWRLSGGRSENVRVMSWHLLEDVLGWAAVLVGSVLMVFTDWWVIDPILSVGITLFILWNVLRRLNATVALFLQGTPQGIDLADVRARLTAIDGVHSDHHTHAWSLDGEHHVLTTHLRMEEDAAAGTSVKPRVREMARAMGFSHVTVEIDVSNEECSMHEEEHGCH